MVEIEAEGSWPCYPVAMLPTRRSKLDEALARLRTSEIGVIAGFTSIWRDLEEGIKAVLFAE